MVPPAKNVSPRFLLTGQRGAELSFALVWRRMRYAEFWPFEDQRQRCGAIIDELDAAHAAVAPAGNSREQAAAPILSSLDKTPT